MKNTEQLEYDTAIYRVAPRLTAIWNLSKNIIAILEVIERIEEANQSQRYFKYYKKIVKAN